MKAKISLFLFTMLLVSGMAFAAGGYYNLVSIQTGISYPMFGGFGAADSTLVLTQDVNTCRDASWAVYFNNSYHSADGTGKIGRYSGFGWQQAFSATGRCVASAESTPENLYKMLKTHWVDAMVAKNLSLGNDIDLGETSSTAGKCVANHVPLPFRENTVFDGQWKKISNMCYVGTAMDKPVGFFESVSNSLVQRIDFNHARVVVKGGSNDGADYYPVGAVAGAAILSTIDSISIANDSLEAPLAGGVVGAVINSTMQNISGDDDIFITNAQLITTGYAGSEYIETAASTDAQKISLATPYSVFLGGLAGVVIRSNEDPSLTGVSVKVDVHDSVSANRSALGGAVGLLFASTETISNVNVLVKKKMNESIPSRISGGSAMGGLVGYVSVFYENNSPVLGRVTIENSSFAGEIKNAASDAIIAVGGLVGRDSSLARMGFSIKNSSAEVTVDDNLETAGAYHYYAGGILGYSNDCISSVVEDDFVSITGSKASGSIAIAAEGDLHVQTFVGGIAGAGCFAMGEVGIKDDTSSVEISTNIKTGNDEQFDSVTVGGILGALNVAGNQGAILSNLLYTGNISVEDGLGYVFAGGVIGRFRGAEGGKPISFNDIMVKSAGKLIDYNATAASKPAGTNVKSTLIGGLCGKCHEIETIERVGVNGGISVAGKYAGDSLFVGGLVARFHNTNHNLKLEANFTIGDISVGSVTAGVNKVGYLLGFGLLKADGYSIRSNYHYGENDLDVNPFGVISETDLSDDGFTASWKTNDLILFNIRNGENKAYTNKHHDGTEIGENMKKSSFAGFLNGAFDKEQGETYAWTFVAGKNNDLPLFADGKNDAVEPDATTLVVTFLDKDGETIVQKNVEDGASLEFPTEEEVPEFAGWHFVGWEEVDVVTVHSDLSVNAIYEINTYEVKFFGKDQKTQIGETQVVDYEGAAVAPEAPTLVGYNFKGWDSYAFESVTSVLNINAVYEAIEYEVTFANYDGTVLSSSMVAYDTWAPEPVNVSREATAAYEYTFVGWDPEVTAVAGEVTYTAVYDSVKVKYDVAFYDFDGKQIGETQSVEYGAAAEEPEAPVSAGRVFKGWSDKTFKEVVKSLEITALYDSASFTVTLLDYKGDSLTALTDVLYNKDLSGQAGPAREATKEYAYTFKGWSPELGKVVSDTVVKAVYDSVKVKYDVAFYDFDGKQIGETQSVEYGAAAVLPAVPEREGFDFVCWSDSARVVTNSLEIRPIYVPAVVSSSSSEPESSSSEPESSSSSEEIESSSSSYLFAEKMIEDSSMVLTGDAFFVGYKVSVVDPALATSVRLVVTGDNGYSMDKILVDSLETSTYSDSLSLLRLPAGNYTAELVVSNDSAADSFTYSFFVQPEITVMARSWQMISMAGVDMNKMDLGRDASFYWWDEQNPIGDYWQYRAYEGEELEATRGYWYGTSEGRSIVLREVTGKVDSSIVWDLDSLFSGWNLVANPYNWYVDLSKGKSDNGDSVQFWRWNPETSEYDIPKVLGPYEAIWVKVNRATRWSMPSAPLFDLEKISSDKKFSSMEKVASLRKGAARKASASSWTLLATLSDNYGKTDSWNVLGAGLQPETMEKAPLGMGEYVRMTIADGKKKLAKSVKNVADEYEWTLNVGANSSRDGKIAFAGVSELNKLGYRLLVTSDGKTAELGEGETFPVALAKTSKRVNIRVVKTGAVASSRQIRGLSMAQASGKLLMQVDVSAALAGAASRYVLVDAKGKTVANGRFTALAGSNSVALKAPVSGQYFMQVQVGSQTLTRRFSVK